MKAADVAQHVRGTSWGNSTQDVRVVTIVARVCGVDADASEVTLVSGERFVVPLGAVDKIEEVPS